MASTSPFGNIYLSLMARLQEQVPELKYIDQDLGQLENYEVRPAVQMPCALIDIGEFDFDDMAGKNMQHGEGLVLVRVAVDPFSASGNLAPEAVREKALSYYDIEQKVYVALHGWRTTGFSKLLRRKSVKEIRDDKFRVKALAFATSFEDDTASPVMITIPRPPVTIGSDVV